MTPSYHPDGTLPEISKALAGFLLCEDGSQRCSESQALPAQLGLSLSLCAMSPVTDLAASILALGQCSQWLWSDSLSPEAV